LGVLSALLGTGYCYGLSWTAMIIPLVVIIWKLKKAKMTN